MYFPSPGGCGYPWAGLAPSALLLTPGRPVFPASAALGMGLSGRGCCAARPLASTVTLSMAGWALLCWTWLYGTQGTVLPELPTSLLYAHIQGHVYNCVPSRVADERFAFLPAQGRWLLHVIRGGLKGSCSLKPFLFLVAKTLLLPALAWQCWLGDGAVPATTLPCALQQWGTCAVVPAAGLMCARLD